MRRKSERTASKKTKASPEKKEKPDKLKRTKTRRRKQSTSSGNESTDETKPVQSAVSEAVVENNPPQTSTKEESPEETDQVWQVKAAEGGDAGEIQKLKICLTRPPSTPERADRSPRSKRKHSRSTSGEPVEDRKKTKHRSKRAGTETKEETDKSVDSQGDEADNEKEQEEKSSEENQTCQTQEVTSNAAPEPSTTDKSEAKPEESKNDSENATTSEESKTESQDSNTESKPETQDKQSDADTTVASPKSETEDSQNSLSEKEDTSRKRSISCEKSEILEIHADESRCESSDVVMIDSQTDDIRQESPRNESRRKESPRKESPRKESPRKESPREESPRKESPRKESPRKESPKKESPRQESPRQESPKPSSEENTESVVDKPEVSIITDDKMKSINSENINSTGDNEVTTNEPHVVESSQSPEKEIVSEIAPDTEKPEKPESPEKSIEKQSVKTSDGQEATVHNGQATTHSNRKRRWGSRPSRITTQKSITISTDVLKDIIPDVKPVEFDEVIEEKKHRRVEVTEKLERPVLPKIVIDNTESVEINKTENDERDKENIKIRESNLSSSRKISIVKDSDSIIARPPSPPRHKQSNILYITNLVRPFTLPQLKNLLQRTGRIIESGFWIDRIKSKCYVQYETEDQAVETRHALHGVTWPVSNPKTLHVDFSTKEDFDKAKANEETDGAQVSTIPGTVEDWLREQDLKRERGELEKPWERKATMREWDVGKNEKGKDKDKVNSRDERLHDKRRHRTPERSPEPARKFKKKEEEAPAKLLDDLFRKTKATPCIYWLPLSAETIAVKEEQRRQHMAEHERRLQELRRTHRRH